MVYQLLLHIWPKNEKGPKYAIIYLFFSVYLEKFSRKNIGVNAINDPISVIFRNTY